MSLEDRQIAIVEEFSRLANWEEKYRVLIETGKKLPPYPEHWRTEDLQVRGCQSRVWLHAELRPDGKVHFSGDSDAVIVKGLVALLLRLYSDATPADILSTAPDFIAKMDLATHLSPSRSNGLFAMVKQIKYYAAAFQAMLNR